MKDFSIRLQKKYEALSVQLKASFWFLVCSFLQKGISMISTPIFTRLFSTAEYGQFGVFASWLNILTPFISLNISYGVYTQGLIKFEQERNVYASALQGLTVSLVSFWTVVYFLFRPFWNRFLSMTTPQVLGLLIIIWMSAAFNFWATEQRVLYRYRALVCVMLCSSLANPILGILLVTHSEDKVTARIVSIALVDLTAYAAFLIFQCYRGRTFFHAYFWKYSLMFNLPLIPHYLSMTVLNSADKIMIQNMVGDSEAGIYSLAYSVSNIMIIFNSALQQSLGPWIYQKIKKREIREIGSVAYPSLICIAVVNLLLILFAPEIVAIFAPAPYYDAVLTIPPVVMSVYFIFSYNLFSEFAFYYEKPFIIMTASIAGAVLNIILNWIFIGLCGYVAAGYTTLACYIVFSVCHYAFMNRICLTCCDGVKPYDTKMIIKISVLFLLSGFLLLLTYPHPAIRYGVALVAAAIVWMERKKLISAARRLIALRRLSAQE